MSTEASPAPPVLGDAGSLDLGGHFRKSYRRKYRKIMVKFEERMRESTGLFKDEQRIFDISQRLAEQTDQILQLLLELNYSPEVPSTLRYDIRPPGKVSNPIPERSEEMQRVQESLRLGRYQVQRGERTVQDYLESKKNILDTIEFAPSRSYATLLKVTSPDSVPYDSSNDPSIPSGAGYLTIKQEEQYLQSLDLFMCAKIAHPRAHATNNIGSKSAERATDREREVQLRNPVSVYNWLRKHQPQVFLQDHETNNDRGSKVSGSRSSKRAAASKEAKLEQDYYDEDGIALEYGPASRGKRKRNDDGAFRPKGGKPGHGSKRKKDGSGVRSKRSSMDARAA